MPRFVPFSNQIKKKTPAYSKSNLCQPPTGGKTPFQHSNYRQQKIYQRIIIGEWVKEPSFVAIPDSVLYSERLIKQPILVLAPSSALGFCYEPCVPSPGGQLRVRYKDSVRPRELQHIQCEPAFGHCHPGLSDVHLGRLEGRAWRSEAPGRCRHQWCQLQLTASRR